MQQSIKQSVYRFSYKIIILFNISFLPLIHAASIHVADTFTIATVISGSGGFKKTGPGTLVLSVLNSYTGPTEVATGALSITHLSALAHTSAVTVDSAAAQKIQNHFVTAMTAPSSFLVGYLDAFYTITPQSLSKRF